MGHPKNLVRRLKAGGGWATRQLSGFVQVARGVVAAAQIESLGTAHKERFTAPLPTVAPEKIAVSATVQCAFQIQ